MIKFGDDRNEIHYNVELKRTCIFRDLDQNIECKSTCEKLAIDCVLGCSQNNNECLRRCIRDETECINCK